MGLFEVRRSCRRRYRIGLGVEIVNGWQGDAVKLALHGEGWAEAVTTMLPKAVEFGKSPGLYINFLATQHPEHTQYRAYGGMASGVGGLYDRIINHSSASFRAKHPCLHYRFLDEPATKSVFCAFAIYPQNRSRGFILLAEGHMIAMLGLYESGAFLRQVVVLGMPAVTGEKKLPLVGVNSDDGLQQGWDNIAAEEARNRKERLKAMELITTGYPVSIKRSPLSSRQKTAQIQFRLIYDHSLNISVDFQKHYPQLKAHQTAIVYIHLSVGKKHHMPWYNCNTSNPILQQFSIWIELKEDKGFWLQAEHPAKKASRKKNTSTIWTSLAQMVIELYSLDE